MSGIATGPRPSPGKEYPLVAHPDTPPVAVRAVFVRLRHRPGDDALLLTFRIDGQEQVALPDRVRIGRADDLWRTTCFEMFLSPADKASYFEFNYSPSTQWAAYQFDAYRSGMRDLRLATDPRIDRGDDTSGYVVQVDQALDDLPRATLAMGLTAVIEEFDGTKSYWALAHAPGPPDFHNRDTFIATLPPPPR